MAELVKNIVFHTIILLNVWKYNGNLITGSVYSYIRRERLFMSKGAASGAVSTIVRLCEWRGVNCNGYNYI